MQERRSREWARLAGLVDRIEEQGRVSVLSPAEARLMGVLYRRACGDLAALRSGGGSNESIAYLNGVLRRAYALINDGRRRTHWRRAVDFYARDLPLLFRQEVRLFITVAALFLAGGAIGAGAVIMDPAADEVMIPPQHRRYTPHERVSQEELTTAQAEQGRRTTAAATFSSFLFTHNLQVAILAFALGLTAGLGTLLIVFVNGVPLGALAASYHLFGEGLFFWAWIMPHGILELTAIFVAGAAGLVLARGLLAPGQRARLDALRRSSHRATLLFLGVVPLLAGAAIVEATLSQLHEPYAPYELKLLVAGMLGLVAYFWLFGAGRWFWVAPQEAPTTVTTPRRSST